MQYVKGLDEPPPRKRLLTQEQKESFWREVEKDKLLWRVVKLAINLPLRRGQILGLRKEDIDLDRQTLLAGASKKRPARLVPMNDTATAILRELCAEIETGYLFIYPKNARVLPKYRGSRVKDFGKRWRNMLIRAGINEKEGSRETNYHFHDLRSWLASDLVKRNVSKKHIQDLFAHSSEQITDVYAASEFDDLREAVKSLDDSISESEGVN
jgi:integrase